MAPRPAQSRPPLNVALVLVGLSTFLVALLALDARATYGSRLTADEPQYLLTALSLAEDLDLDIADEIDEDRFRPFHEQALNPQTIDLDESGQRLSPHDPLLPLVLAAPMGLGGWAAAKAALAVIAGATAAATLWVAVRRVSVSIPTAAIVTGALFAAPPLTSYATQVYPEMPAALVVVSAVGALIGHRSARSDALALLAVLVLPWLAVKYVPIAAVIAVALIWPRSGSDRRRSAVLIGALGVGGLAYLIVHQRIYGGWTVYAAGDHFVDDEFQVMGADPDYPGRSRRLIGLLIDRTFGLMPWTPAYLALVPALAAGARRRPPGWPLMASILAVGWAVATWIAFTMHGWWWPGRQIIVVLPLGVVMIASFVDGRVLLRRLVVIGSALGTVAWLWLVVEASTDRRTLVVDFFETANPWYRLWAPLFPDHMDPGRIDLALSIVWILLGIVASVAAWRLEGRTEQAGPASTRRPPPRDSTDQPGADRAGRGPGARTP